MIYLTPCSPGKKVTYSHHDIPDTLLTWQKSYLFCHDIPDTLLTWQKILILAMIYLTPCSPGKKVTYSRHDIPDTLLTWQKSNLFCHDIACKKVTYSAMIYDLLTWQKSNLFLPWYTWHTAHLAKKKSNLLSCHDIPDTCSPGCHDEHLSGISWHLSIPESCSPGKKVTYSHHDIPEVCSSKK